MNEKIGPMAMGAVEWGWGLENYRMGGRGSLKQENCWHRGEGGPENHKTADKWSLKIVAHQMAIGTPSRKKYGIF